jgi:hypothetical protein
MLCQRFSILSDFAPPDESYDSAQDFRNIVLLWLNDGPSRSQLGSSSRALYPASNTRFWIDSPDPWGWGLVKNNSKSYGVEEPIHLPVMSKQNGNRLHQGCGTSI